MPLLARLRHLWLAFWSSRDRYPCAIGRRLGLERLEVIAAASSLTGLGSPFADVSQVGQPAPMGVSYADYSLSDMSNGGGLLPTIRTPRRSRPLRRPRPTPPPSSR